MRVAKRISDEFKRKIEERKETFKSGARIVVVETIDDPTPLPKGLEGTVRFVDDIGSIHPIWDNGSTLAALLEDKIKLI
ncbi:hypothetical protein JOD29_000492 [Lysinibacillus composti]|uniref:DUF4314 domain-containing protein n=1 Tax=Lysinibacillus composti TaxID=720633 RepID=A0A3N9ULK1_9BACI|nr:DUF4314 domain-containing protein [Lysinibacillus composti]MBM7607255.1 hypothetical protein [Lysinibacillus composti]RQW76168.1 DUF4314 domain-containing protein [Lysinibacillus composti]